MKVGIARPTRFGRWGASTTEEKSMPYIDCKVCGEPVKLSRKRALALWSAEEQPVCRKNGCYRYVGIASGRDEVLGVTGLRVKKERSVSKTGRPLENLVVSRCGEKVYDPRPDS